MKHIRTLIAKEWAEVFKNRIVVFTVGALPLLMAVLPLGILLSLRGTSFSGGDTTDLPPSMIKACGAISVGDCFQVYLLNQFLSLFMIMPLFIPIAIASYSIVGEKTTRSLEPLLATPITTEELLAGKALAAVIPAVLATWGSFAVFLIGLPIVGAGTAALLTALSPTWFAATLLIGPLVAVLAVIFALMISSRVNDPRVAEQISGALVVPVIGMIFAQLAGVLVVNLQLMVTVAAVLAVIDVILIFFGARLFQREVILTRWK